MKRIAFLSFGFRKSNLRKQPWNYIYKICNGLIDSGDTVCVISDDTEKAFQKQNIGNLFVHNVGRIHPWSYKNIVRVLNSEKTDLIIWSFAPKSIVFYPLLKSLGRPIIFFTSIPLYNLLEILIAQKILGRYNLSLYYKNALIPNFLIKHVVNSRIVGGIITLTQKNKIRLIEFGCMRHKIWFIPHGRIRNSHKNDVKDKPNCPCLKKPQQQKPSQNIKSFLYMGGPEQIRGLSWLIQASASALLQNPKLRFTILLRTEDAFFTTVIKSECDRYGLCDSVNIINSILPPQKVVKRIIDCDFVVLPFILVPSEVPISILEAMKAGKPVVGTSVDGIPELIKERGIVVKPGDSDALEKAILRLAFDDPYRKTLGKKCKEYMKRYPKWEDSLRKLTRRLDNL